jgi:hypothetical protein
MRLILVLITTGILITNLSLAQHLPVELVYFEGSADSNGVNLIWGTATEVNNYGYNVERSIEQINWDVIGFVPGNGNSNSPKDYVYTDSEIPANGIYYYRLMQIDTDGQYEYTDVVLVEYNFLTGINEPTGNIVNDYLLKQNYPNPFNPGTSIEFYLPKASDIRLEICTTSGEGLSILLNQFLPAGMHVVEFNALTSRPRIASGVYIYRLITANTSLNKKLILVK